MFYVKLLIHLVKNGLVDNHKHCKYSSFF